MGKENSQCCCKDSKKEQAPRPASCCGDKGCNGEKEEGHTCCCNDSE